MPTQGPNRLTRDQIIHEALNMTDSPTLDQKERPDGVNILTTAFSITWLQRFIDLFHVKFPFSATLQVAQMGLLQGSVEYAMPQDFIQEYRNGIVYRSPDTGRIWRAPLDKQLDYEARTDTTRTQAKPSRFTVVGPGLLRFWPTPDKNYSVDVWYYAMPAPLGQSDIPRFPSDHILVECLHLRQREWLQMVAPNTALSFAHSAIAELQKGGISNEPEPDDIPLDPSVFLRQGANNPSGWSGWMGPGVPNI